MKTIEKLQNSIDKNREAIASQEAILESLQREEDSLNQKLENCEDLEIIETLVKETKERQEAIAQERKVASLKLKTLKAHLTRLQAELEQTEEVNREKLRVKYELKIRQVVPELNKLADAYVAKLNEVRDTIAEAHREATRKTEATKPSWEKQSYFYTGNTIGGTIENQLTKLVFDLERSKVCEYRGREFDRACQRLDDEGKEYLA